MKLYEVTFTANYIVCVKANSESQARLRAGRKANIANDQFTSVSGIADDDIIIHADDIIRVQEVKDE